MLVFFRTGFILNQLFITDNNFQMEKKSIKTLIIALPTLHFTIQGDPFRFLLHQINVKILKFIPPTLLVLYIFKIMDQLWHLKCNIRYIYYIFGYLVKIYSVSK